MAIEDTLEHVKEDLVALHSRLVLEKAPDPYSNKGSKYAEQIKDVYLRMKPHLEKFEKDIAAQTEKIEWYSNYAKTDNKFVDSKTVESLKEEYRVLESAVAIPGMNLITVYDALYNLVQIKKEMIPIYDESFELGCKLRALDEIIPAKRDSLTRKIVDLRSAYSGLLANLSKASLDVAFDDESCAALELIPISPVFIKKINPKTGLPFGPDDTQPVELAVPIEDNDLDGLSYILVE